MINQTKRALREFTRSQPGHRFQQRYKRRQQTTSGLFDPKNLLYLGGGIAIIIIGVLIAPVPGPGGVIAVVGLAMLGSLFRPVARALDWGELWVRRIAYWVTDLWQVLPLGMKVLVGLLAVIVAITVAYTAYQVMAGG